MRDGGFPAYVATASLARSATEAAPSAVLLVTLATGRGASVGALLVAAFTGAAAVSGPLVGAALDRTVRPRREFTLSLAWMAATLAALALVIAEAPLGLSLLLAFAAGCAYPSISGAWSAQLPWFIAAPRLPRAYAADAATYSVAAVVGPPLAAAVLVGGPRLPLLVPVVLLLGAVLAIRRVPIRDRVLAATGHSLGQDLRAGLGVLWRRPALRRITIMTTLAFAGQAGLVIAAPLISQELTGGLEFTGVILGAFATGGIVVAAIYLRRPVTRPDLTAAVTTLVAGLALAGVALAPTAVLVLVAAAVMGATDAPMLAAMFQVRTREAPAGLRAQVFTTSASLRLTAFAVMSAVLGAVIGWGPTAIALIGAGVHLLGVLLGVLAGPGRRPRRAQPASGPLPPGPGLPGPGLPGPGLPGPGLPGPVLPGPGLPGAGPPAP